MTMRRVPIPFGKVPTELVDEAVQAIREGKVVALPTETVYGLAADPADPASSERIRALKERPADLVFTHHIASAADLAAFAPAVPKRVQQLCDRYWPGPLTMVVPTGEGESVGLRVPSDDFTTAVIRAFGSSLYLTSVNRSGEPPLTSPDEIEAEFGDRIDLLYDVGDPPLRQASTVVRWIPSTVDPELGELEILREGTLTAEDLHGTTSRRFLFVCTGNTCRSPLAEALARRAAARRLGTSDARVAAHGLVFESAGVAAGVLPRTVPPRRSPRDVAGGRGQDRTPRPLRRRNPRSVRPRPRGLPAHAGGDRARRGRQTRRAHPRPRVAQRTSPCP
jgi:tRNA threonylcarbamoyl adenosine modification protein (Sua5/YciO/YrdC/YwlC family)